MKKLFLSIAVVILCQISFGQSSYTVDPSSKVTVKGTSTLHDWTSETKTIQGNYVFKSAVTDKKFPTSGSIVSDVKLVIPVTSLYSERGDAMNNKTHNAFVYETNPEITFVVKSDQLKEVTKEGKFKLVVTGDLTMAGHTESITLDMEGERLANNQLKFFASKKINMTTYEMVPPSAMFGQIKTGEEVTIEFDLLLNNTK
ncbi:MAG: YceI family protein [Cyclobacteriaceae bacterium]|nr:YceI family protein [Cyclobacteriaceae bacterium SS2]